MAKSAAMTLAGAQSRKAAMRLLDAVLRRGTPLEAALPAATQGLERAEDRALAHAIASESLRRMADLDILIDSATRLRLADDAKVRMVLRMALVQALVLETPPHAVIATALPLLEGGPRRLAHGVLGTLLRRGDRLPELPALPPPVQARWARAWGETMTDTARAALAAPPPLDLTLRHMDQTEEWAARLEGDSLVPGHVRIARGRAVEDLPGFGDGAWWVQNIAASLPARLLGEGHGRHVLDLCAAPGGKTMQLAASGWQVTALDSSTARIARLESNLARTGLAADLIAADVMDWAPSAPADAILLDAPCSATGIFARHPDVLHRVRDRDIASLAKVQAAMLARVASWLQPGGVLIYAVCSLEPEEGEQIVAAPPPGLVADPVQPQELVAGFTPTPTGWVRIYPQLGCDGFFIARFRKG